MARLHPPPPCAVPSQPPTPKGHGATAQMSNRPLPPGDRGIHWGTRNASTV